MRFGIGYMGSKSKIAQQIIDSLPPADTFVDLFCGGGAMTHCAMLSGKYKHFIINDIDKLAVDCLTKAFNGGYKDEKRWISREDFFELKDTDPYVKFCWSFGNSGNAYLYGKDIEPYKKALHLARVFNDFSLFEEMDIDLKNNCSSLNIKNQKEEIKKQYIKWYTKTILKSDVNVEETLKKLKEKTSDNKNKLREYLLEAKEKSGLTSAQIGKRLNNFMAGHYFGRSQWAFPTKEMYDKMREFMPLMYSHEEIYGVQYLYESLERLESYVGDYQNVIIPDNSVIYCDIPYKNTATYTESETFDYDRFYSWAEKQTQPIFISEYGMPEDRFECVKQIEKRSLLSAKGNNKIMIEKLYIPRTSKHNIKKEPQQLMIF